LAHTHIIDPVVFAADTFFDLIKRWTRNVDVFAKDYIFIPINEK